MKAKDFETTPENYWGKVWKTIYNLKNETLLTPGMYYFFLGYAHTRNALQTFAYDMPSESANILKREYQLKLEAIRFPTVGSNPISSRNSGEFRTAFL